ncbi:hypothetical protein KIW84_063907 [Lathyrus oleraceus]|uniref:Cytochrome c domain-containing protein n=1 Tax=Pisum sativum TaxID=3888 RepID=A0A9D5A7X8_PEA|nr:hypothetical protein KIW84_063907 [Pisum sativum]
MVTTDPSVTGAFPQGTSHVTANAENHGYSAHGGRSGRGGGRYGRGGGRFGKMQCRICHKSEHDASIATTVIPTLLALYSGASHHVTPDASNLSGYISLPRSEQVFMGNDQDLSINFVGSMFFPLPNYPNMSLILQNLLLVPHITKNLISSTGLGVTVKAFLNLFLLAYTGSNHGDQSQSDSGSSHGNGGDRGNSVHEEPPVVINNSNNGDQQQSDSGFDRGNGVHEEPPMVINNGNNDDNNENRNNIVFGDRYSNIGGNDQEGSSYSLKVNIPKMNENNYNE